MKAASSPTPPAASSAARPMLSNICVPGTTWNGDRLRRVAGRGDHHALRVCFPFPALHGMRHDLRRVRLRDPQAGTGVGRRPRACGPRRRRCSPERRQATRPTASTSFPRGPSRSPPRTAAAASTSANRFFTHTPPLGSVPLKWTAGFQRSGDRAAGGGEGRIAAQRFRVERARVRGAPLPLRGQAGVVRVLRVPAIAVERLAERALRVRQLARRRPAPCPARSSTRRARDRGPPLRAARAPRRPGPPRRAALPRAARAAGRPSARARSPRGRRRRASARRLPRRKTWASRSCSRGSFGAARLAAAQRGRAPPRRRPSAIRHWASSRYAAENPGRRTRAASKCGIASRRLSAARPARGRGSSAPRSSRPRAPAARGSAGCSPRSPSRAARPGLRAPGGSATLYSASLSLGSARGVAGVGARRARAQVAERAELLQQVGGHARVSASSPRARRARSAARPLRSASARAGISAARSRVSPGSALQVVQLGARGLDVLPAPVAQRAQVAPPVVQQGQQRFRVGGLGGGIGAVPRSAGASERPLPFQPAGGGTAEQVEHGRAAGRRSAPRSAGGAPGRDARPAHDQRNAQRGLVDEEAVHGLAVLAQALAVVGRDHDQRLVAEAEARPARRRAGPPARPSTRPRRRRAAPRTATAYGSGGS